MLETQPRALQLGTLDSAVILADYDIRGGD